MRILPIIVISTLFFISCYNMAMEKFDPIDSESLHLHYSAVTPLRTLCSKALCAHLFAPDGTTSLKKLDNFLQKTPENLREEIIALWARNHWMHHDLEPYKKSIETDHDDASFKLYTPALHAHLQKLLHIKQLSSQYKKNTITLKTTIPANMQRYATADKYLIFPMPNSKRFLMDEGRERIIILDFTTGDLMETHHVFVNQHIGKIICDRTTLCYAKIKSATIFDDILIEDLSDKTIESIHCHKGFSIDFKDNYLACARIKNIEIFKLKNKIPCAVIPCDYRVKELSVNATFLAAHARDDTLEENYLAVWNWKTGKQLYHKLIKEFRDQSDGPTFLTIHNGKILYLTTDLVKNPEPRSTADPTKDCLQINLLDIQSGINTILVSSLNSLDKIFTSQLRNFQLHKDHLYYVSDLFSIHSINLISGKRLIYPIPIHEERRITHLKILGTVDSYLIASLEQKKTSDSSSPDDKSRVILFSDKDSGAFLHHIYGIGLALHGDKLYFLPQDGLESLLYIIDFNPLYSTIDEMN